MKTETIKDIPQEKVQQVVASYQSEGYTTQIIKQPNGLYTVIAVLDK
jgi:hypothetical protein